MAHDLPWVAHHAGFVPTVAMIAAVAVLLRLALTGGGGELEYTFDGHEEHGIPELLRRLSELGIEFKDLQTRQSSLEDIFVSLVKRQ